MLLTPQYICGHTSTGNCISMNPFCVFVVLMCWVHISGILTRIFLLSDFSVNLNCDTDMDLRRCKAASECKNSMMNIGAFWRTKQVYPAAPLSQLSLAAIFCCGNIVELAVSSHWLGVFVCGRNSPKQTFLNSQRQRFLLNRTSQLSGMNFQGYIVILVWYFSVYQLNCKFSAYSFVQNDIHK